MFQIQNLTDNAKQNQTLVLPDGTQIGFALYYSLQQLGWFVSITYGTFQVTNMRISNNANILRQYRNQIPFGMYCTTPPSDREPTLIQDFSSGASQLFIISAAEVAAYEAFLSGSVSS